MSMEEIEALNPHFLWSRRKTKRRVKSLAKKLIPNVTYAMGCRGHPGLIIHKDAYFDSDIHGCGVEIKSLVDGVEESCSIFYCCPQPIKKEYALKLAEYMKTHHWMDVSIKYYNYTPEEMATWVKEWVAEGKIYYIVSDCDGITTCSSQALSEEDADEEIERLSMEHFKKNGISNPRKVDFREYPARPTLVDLG